MAKENLKKIKIAFVAHPHGIKGEAEVRLVNPENVLEKGMQVWLYPSSDKSKISPEGEQWTLSQFREGNKIIAQFEGVKDRTHLESLIPFEIYLDRDDFPEVEEGEFYLVDLVDLQVMSPEGEELGVVEGFSDNGMQTLLDVRLKDGSTVLLPFVEAFFPEVDIEKGTVTMILPEYME